MTRQIKFRAWDKKNKAWVANGDSMDLNYSACSNCFLFDNDSYDLHEDVEFVQFTGLTDKNGKEIYEGDLFKAEEPQFESQVATFEVVFTGGCFWAVDKTPDESYRDGFKHGMNPLFIFQERKKDMEVIGNIYENPELLK